MSPRTSTRGGSNPRPRTRGAPDVPHPHGPGRGPVHVLALLLFGSTRVLTSSTSPIPPGALFVVLLLGIYCERPFPRGVGGLIATARWGSSGSPIRRDRQLPSPLVSETMPRSSRRGHHRGTSARSSREAVGAPNGRSPAPLGAIGVGQGEGRRGSGQNLPNGSSGRVATQRSGLPFFPPDGPGQGCPRL
jgi:hypothetical protein